MVKVHNRRRKLTRCVSSVMDEARVTLRPVQSGDEEFIFRLFAGSRPGQGWLTGLSKEEKEGFLRQQFHSECESLLDNYPLRSSASSYWKENRSAGSICSVGSMSTVFWPLPCCLNIEAKVSGASCSLMSCRKPLSWAGRCK